MKVEVTKVVEVKIQCDKCQKDYDNSNSWITIKGRHKEGNADAVIEVNNLEAAEEIFDFCSVKCLANYVKSMME